jgi:peptide/nickel transport system permease protein
LFSDHIHLWGVQSLMWSYALHRTGAAAATLAAASVIIFFFIHLIPGDPIYVLLGDVATPDQVDALRAKLGLDQPIISQYLRWLANVVRGDFGTSIFFQAPVARVILDGAETSILLASVTMIWIVLIGVPVGVIAAIRHGSWLDQGLSGLAMLLASIPTFWVGLYLILIFAVWLGLLPSSGYPSIFEQGGLANLRYLLLPSLTLAAPNAALILRLTRASMLDVAREDYVRTARAKGIRPARVVFRHILRNALLAVVSAFGFTFAALISEAVVTETVFALPGIGQLVVQSVLRRDYPVIQGIILVTVVLYLVINLLVDLSYRFLDPRVELR